MKYFLSILIITVLLTNNMYSQKLNHELGEIIIQVENNRDFHNMMRSMNNNDRYRDSHYKQICREPLNLWLLKTNPNEINELDLLEDIIMNKNVLNAQQNHIINYRSTIPNDPEFNNQWQYINNGQTGGKIDIDLDIEEAWDITTGGLSANGDTIVACVIDNGMYKNHEDFNGRLWTNKAEIPNNGIDDDNNGWKDDYLGWDTTTDIDTTIFINGSHGTSVAGIIGAAGNNNIGVSGINWNIKLMIIQGGGNEAQALEGYAYPYYFRKKYNETNGAEGAFVVTTNASWGTDYAKAEDNPIWCEFYNKLGEIGILSCAATINKNVNVDVDGDMPTTCTSDFLISVTNINKFGLKPLNAGYGKKSIDLGAFGSETWTSLTNNIYGQFGGCSAASPHVAGTVALLYSIPCQEFSDLSKEHPELAARFIKHTILAGVNPANELKNITVTGGILNIKNSIDLAMNICGEYPYPIDGAIASSNPSDNELTWSNPEGAIQTNLRYRLQGNINWINKMDITSPYQLGDIGLCNTYEYQLQSVYPNGTKSEYSFKYKYISIGCCEAPSDLEYEYIEGTSDIRVLWNSYDDASVQTIEYKKTDDSQWNSFETAANNYVFSDIEPCTGYMCRILSTCQYASSSYSDVLIFGSECGNCTLEYCDYGSPDNKEEWISRVSIGTLDNYSGADDDSYGNFLGINIPDLSRENLYTIILKPEYKGTSFSDYFKVWIDFNQNQVFENDEVAYDPGDVTSTELTGTVHIPEDAALGITRMRVTMRYNKAALACGTNSFQYGEVEDYCVNIIENSSSTIETTDNDSAITLSPNPFLNSFTVSFLDIKKKEVAELSIKNAQGKSILKKHISLFANDQNEVRFSQLDYLSSGLYFLTIKIDNQTNTYKVIKL